MGGGSGEREGQEGWKFPLSVCICSGTVPITSSPRLRGGGEQRGGVNRDTS